jgi:hypothetical protein
VVVVVEHQVVVEVVGVLYMVAEHLIYNRLTPQSHYIFLQNRQQKKTLKAFPKKQLFFELFWKSNFQL